MFGCGGIRAAIVVAVTATTAVGGAVRCVVWCVTGECRFVKHVNTGKIPRNFQYLLAVDLSKLTFVHLLALCEGLANEYYAPEPAQVFIQRALVCSPAAYACACVCLRVLLSLM